jgi:hypothetical protein
LILSAKYADINLALVVESGFMYLNDVRKSGSLDTSYKGYVRTTTINGFNVLILEDTNPPLNNDIPDEQGIYWNSEQEASYTYSGSCRQEPYIYPSVHVCKVSAHSFSSNTSVADANQAAYNKAEELAMQDANVNGFCSNVDNDTITIYYP